MSYIWKLKLEDARNALLRLYLEESVDAQTTLGSFQDLKREISGYLDALHQEVRGEGGITGRDA